MGGTLGSTHEAAKLLVFPCNGALMGSLSKAGYEPFDLIKLCQDDDGNPTRVPPETRTLLEAAKRAGVHFLIVANTQGDPAIYRITEMLQTIGIKDYEIRVENFGDSTGPAETLARIRTLVDGRAPFRDTGKPTTERKRNPYKLTTCADLKAAVPPWLSPRVLPKGVATLITGRAGHGKSAFVRCLVAQLAAGRGVMSCPD